MDNSTITPMVDDTTVESYDIVETPQGDLTGDAGPSPYDDSLMTSVAKVSETKSLDPEASAEYTMKGLGSLMFIDKVTGGNMTPTEANEMFSDIYTVPDTLPQSHNVDAGDLALMENGQQTEQKTKEAMQTEIEAGIHLGENFQNIKEDYQKFIVEEVEGGRSITNVVKELQRHVGMIGDDLDGKLGPKSVKALGSIQPLPGKEQLITYPSLEEITYDAPKTTEKVAELQTSLGVRADGKFGKGTKQAIDAHNFRVSGKEVGTGVPVAQMAGALGIRDEELERLIKIESGGQGYTAMNKGTAAYGKYQFMPDTAKHYYTKLKIPKEEWMTAKNQDRMFLAFTEDNKKALQNAKIDITPLTLYGAHQQGAAGIKDILESSKGGKFKGTNTRKNIKQNLPYPLNVGVDKLSDAALATRWLKHWKTKV